MNYRFQYYAPDGRELKQVQQVTRGFCTKYGIDDSARWKKGMGGDVAIGWLPENVSKDHRGFDIFDVTKATVAVRVIKYKVNGSRHACDHRCMGAKGGNCECSCGGKNHGKAA